MKKLEIFSLHPVVSWQPPNPQNYNYFRFGAILLCIAKFFFFFLSGQIIFCSLMTNYNFTGVILHTWPGKVALASRGE